MGKSNQREVAQKVRKGEQSFLLATCRLNLIHIAMKFYSDIPYGHRVMMHKRIVCKKVIKGLRNSRNLRKGEQPFLNATRRLDRVHIAMKFHQNIPYGHPIMSRTRIVYAGWPDG